ncbi:MAG: hypothetical protein O7D33_06150 [Chloroflexi bacterium]|nr:hypothetical protein [Chloroflexota bacterium]
MPRLAQYHNIPLRKGGPDAWMHRNLQRAIVLIGGLDEEDAVKVLEQEGV